MRMMVVMQVMMKKLLWLCPGRLLGGSGCCGGGLVLGFRHRQDQILVPFLEVARKTWKAWSGQKGNHQLEHLYGYGNNAIRDDTGGRWFALFQDKREGREGMKKKEKRIGKVRQRGEKGKERSTKN
jgi:hypothetical protein